MGKMTAPFLPWVPLGVALVLLYSTPKISAAACPVTYLDSPSNSTCTDAQGNSVSCQGTSGDDTLICNSGSCNIDGAGGHDTIVCTVAPCRINGGNGDDSIRIAPTTPNPAATNDICGGDDNDTITGADGVDTISGEAGHDTLDGLAGVDTLDGGAGDDTINGGAGHDNISDSSGADTVDGGADGASCAGFGADDSLRNCN